MSLTPLTIRLPRPPPCGASSAAGAAAAACPPLVEAQRLPQGPALSLSEGEPAAATALRWSRRECSAACGRRRARSGRAARRGCRLSPASTCRRRQSTSRCRCPARRHSCSTACAGADTCSHTAPCCSSHPSPDRSRRCRRRPSAPASRSSRRQRSCRRRDRRPGPRGCRSRRRTRRRCCVGSMTMRLMNRDVWRPTFT